MLSCLLISSLALLFSVANAAAAVPLHAFNVPVPVTGVSSLTSAAAVATSAISLQTITISPATYPEQSASKTSPVSPTPTFCGEYGPYTLSFDDLPNVSASNSRNNTPPIIENPYHQLYFGNGYAYAPRPEEPYKPISPPNLAVFYPNETQTPTNNVDGGLGLAGEIEAGPYNADNAFWFNVTDVYLGCEPAGPNPCEWDVVAFAYDPATGMQTQKANKAFTTPPCTEQHCQLEHVEFPASFVGLSGVQFFAYVDDAPVVFYMDNLAMGWYNNSCAAGIQRIQQGGPP